MARHLTPTDLARDLGMERRDVIAKCMELGVPIYQGRIDKAAFTRRLQEDVTTDEPQKPVTYKVTEVREAADFEWALLKDDDTPIAWLLLNDYGQWEWSGADTYGNPDSNTTSEIDLGDLDRQAEFREAYEAAAMERSEAVKEALLTAHHAKLALYRDETFDLAIGVAKRRAERLEW